MKRQHLLLGIFGMLFLFSPINMSWAESSDWTLKWENALMTERWSQILEESGDIEAVISKETKDCFFPEQRAIIGHACLALNRNDESLFFFHSIANEEDTARWLAWTTDLVNRNPNNPVALYLKGDALARMDKWREATEIYSSALEKKGNFALALNARGVAWAALKEYNKARDDIDAAIAFAPGFADAYASRGTLKLLKDTPDTAIDDYSQAIQKTESFALAYNGRACARIARSQDPQSLQESILDFSKAQECKNIASLVLVNAKMIKENTTEQLQDLSQQTKEGMTIKTRSLFGQDSKYIADSLRRAPTSDLLKFHSDSKKFADHSDRYRGMEILISANPLNIGIAGKYKTPGTDGDKWRTVTKLIGQELETRGVGINQGGATTEDIKNAYTYRKMPTITWFGLLQSVEPSIAQLNKTLGKE